MSDPAAIWLDHTKNLTTETILPARDELRQIVATNIVARGFALGGRP